jgi:hypothetical protein
LSLEVPSNQFDRRCGSGLQAIVNVAMMVQTGMLDVVVAGGVESMSNIEHYSTEIRKDVRAGNLTLHDRLTRGRVGKPRHAVGPADMDKVAFGRRHRARPLVRWINAGPRPHPGGDRRRCRLCRCHAALAAPPPHKVRSEGRARRVLTDQPRSAASRRASSNVQIAEAAAL